MLTAIEGTLSRLEGYPAPRFIVELTAVCFVLKIVFVLLASVIFSAVGISTAREGTTEADLVQFGAEFGALAAFLLVILFAAIETLVAQWLVLWVASKFTQQVALRVVISAVVFSLLHVEPMLMAAVFPIGLVLAWAFIVKRKKSRAEAFWITTAIHVAHNLIVLAIVARAL